MLKNKFINILPSVIMVALVGAGLYFILTSIPVSAPSPSLLTPKAGFMTVKGKIICLPKKGTGPSTEECAIGLLGEDGKHYGLKNFLAEYAEVDLQVEVSGVFTPEEIRGPAGSTYDTVGMIDATSIKVAAENSGLNPINPSLSPIMSVAELWVKREELADKQVKVKDAISFEVNCAAVEPPDPDTCGTKVLMGPFGGDHFELLRDGKNLACNGSPQTCQGFERGKVYTLDSKLVRCSYQNLRFCLEIGAPSAQTFKNEGVLSVVDLTSNKETYVGKQVRVQGRISVHVFYGERACAPDEPVCDTSVGVSPELWQPKTVLGAENFLLLFTKNQPYPCDKTAPGIYACPPYINDQITTIEGIWSKDQVPVQWVNTSPVKWEDRYFLNVTSNINANQSSTSPSGDAAICGRVWYIPGAVGFDAGGIADDEIKLFQSGKLVATTSTDASGEFKFKNLTESEYVATDKIYSQSITVEAVAGQCVEAKIVISAPSSRD